MRTKKWWFLLALLAILGGGGFFFSLRTALKQDRAQEPAVHEKERSSSVKVDDFNYVQNTDGKNEWRLEAREASYSRSPQTVTFRKVDFVYYLPGGEEMRILGDRGVMNLRDRSVKLKGNVRMELGKGIRLETREAFYNDRTKRITAPGRVSIRTPTCLITGRRLNVEVSKRRLFLEQNVEARVSRWNLDYHL